MLVELISGQVAPQFRIVWSFWRYAFEPFTGPAHYILSFSRYNLQLLSWIFWLAAFSVCFGLILKRPFSWIVKRGAYAWTVFLSFVMFSLLFPLPSPRLVLPPGFTAIDFHSHTFFSHDAAGSPGQNAGYHDRLGFSAFFVTDHGTTRGFERFPADRRLKTVFPGMEFQTREGISILVLGDRPFEPGDFSGKSIKEAAAAAHEKGFIVICPHWWKWRHPSLEELARDGIDGFEIYNAGYRNLSENERGHLVRFCAERNLLMLASTDWHGWGRTSDVWTVIEARGMPYFDHLRGRLGTSIIVEDKRELRTPLRYAAEPFFGAYYYLRDLDIKKAGGWALWIVVMALAGSLRRSLNWGRVLPLAMSGLFLAAAVYYFFTWLTLLPDNEVLGHLLSPLLLVLGIAWFGLSRLRFENE